MMSDEKVVYLSSLLEKPLTSGLPEDSLTLISAFIEIRSPERRQAVIDFCEKHARTEHRNSD